MTIDNAERDMLSFDAMECSSKCSRREFFAAAAAFGAVAPLLGVEGNARILPTGLVDEHLVVFLAGVGTGGNVNPDGTDGDILSRQVAAILKMRPLPGRCVILPESSGLISSAASFSVKIRRTAVWLIQTIFTRSRSTLLEPPMPSMPRSASSSGMSWSWPSWAR